jgi:subtilase family serine protease
MKLFALLALVLVATAGVASAVRHAPSRPSSNVAQHVLYTRTSAPDDWKLATPAEPHMRVEFTLALKQRNLDILEKWFNEVSDPKHHNYQEYKSIDEIASLVAPTEKDQKSVMHWLHAHGIHAKNIKSFGDAIDVTATVKQAEKLFSTKFFNYHHIQTGASVVRQFGSYSVPVHLRHIIEMVTGISSFPVPHLKGARVDAANDYGVVPQSIDALYSISQEARKMYSKARAVKSSTVPFTSQGVIEFQGEDFAPSDLALFGQQVDETIQAVPANQIVGPNDPTNPDDEPALDIEVVAGVNLEASNWFWLENGNGWLYQFGVHFFSTEDVPQVSSISYGWWEGDQCSIDTTGCSQLGVDSTGYVNRVNVEFQKIGLRGLTLIAASGDSGANGRTNGDCSVPQLRPSFPGVSPYITSVGATELANNTLLADQPPICASTGLSCAETGYEQAVSYAISNFASGGGFSNISSRPSWQNAAVNAYLNNPSVTLPPASYFNAAGRGHPDVAAMGHNILIILSNSSTPVGGTSASSPTFAAVIALLNQAQIAETGKPLGFLNPFLYQMYAEKPSAFNDIVTGDNTCTEDGCQPGVGYGFYCAKGWDPVTGLGSPNFPEMLAYVKESAARRRAAKAKAAHSKKH